MWVNVILPLRVKGLFIYKVPQNLENDVQLGKRIIVSFGKRKKYTALIAEIINQPPQTGYSIKTIASIIDKRPVVLPWQLEFWTWMANYYMCYIGEVMNAALPANLRLESQSRYILNHSWDQSLTLSRDEKKIVFYLQQHDFILEKDIPNLLGKKNIKPTLKKLIEKQIILLQEHVREKRLTQYVTCVKLKEPYQNEETFLNLLQNLERKSPRQYETLLKIFDVMQKGNFPLKKELQQAVNSSILKAIERKGIIEFFEKEVETHGSLKKEFSFPKIQFTSEQERVIEQIHNAFASNKNVLLYGPTGSGKTLIYAHFIREVLLQGKQVLYLLPEISLTEFMVERIRIWLGKDVPLWVYHSRTSTRERTEVWKEMLEGRVGVVVGARSAIFLPYQSLGLIVVDEEHDISYKQAETPRYHARDVALMLGKITGAHVILGSATPSLDTYHLTKTGKLILVHLNNRFGDTVPPSIHVVNMRPHIARKEMKGSLTPMLHQFIKQTLQRGKQIILFQNRRGYSTWVECDACGWSPSCQHCDTNLTYHREIHALLCHHCGFTSNVPAFCPNCHSPKIIMRGVGTQRVEDELSAFFPNARIARLDHDFVRRSGQLQVIFEQFEQRQIDILVGTQMVTKGLDFSNVELVGVLNADLLYPYPDYRSYEHALQLMLQVAGRAGRRDQQGLVIIQTQTSRSPLVKYIIQLTYDDFLFNEVLFRQKFQYPPFVRLIKFQFLHQEQNMAMNAANDFAHFFKEKFPYPLLGPDLAPIARIQDNYIYQILIKLPRDRDLRIIKQSLLNILETVQSNFPSTLRVIIDVDPI